MEIAVGLQARLGKGLLAAVFVAAWAGVACAQNTIKYLPRHEDMDSKEKNYRLSPITLSERACTQTDVFQKAAECYTCIQDWIPNCPECCLDFKNHKVWCADINCRPGGKLSGAACMNKTCNSMVGKPEGGTCVWSGGWYCDKDNLVPSRDCLDRIQGALTECGAVRDFYDTEEVLTGCPITPAPAKCYKYTQTSQLKDCIDRCNGNAENCEDLGDCKQAHCGTSLYDARCGSAQCQNRLAHPECRVGLSEQQCAELTNDAMDCLAGSGCSGCFQEIDRAFYYRFIAKSRESVTVLWEVSSEPQVNPSASVPPYFFYTKVQVFDEKNLSVPVHESVIHQKYLGAAFSIFCATHIDKAKLKPGRAYRARLYYYLPECPDADLSIRIYNLRFIAIRIRE